MFRLISSMAQLLPPKTRAKVMAKMGLRKVSVVGSAIAAVGDAIEIGRGVSDVVTKGSWRTLLRGFIGLGSTACGVVPGFGTAASTAIDLGLLAEDVANITRPLSINLIGVCSSSP